VVHVLTASVLLLGRIMGRKLLWVSRAVVLFIRPLGSLLTEISNL
jgi:hypothetical protein